MYVYVHLKLHEIHVYFMFLLYIKLTAPFFSSEQKSKVIVLFCVLRRKNVFVNRFIYNDCNR